MKTWSSILAPAVLGLAAAALLAGCTMLPVSRSTEPVRFDRPPAPPGGDPFPNWPVHPDQVETILAEARAEIVELKRGVAGTTGAVKATYRFPEHDDIEFTVKWKKVPEDLDGINNAPRKELAAYEIQKLFLSPEDYVVPTSVTRCARLEFYRQLVDPKGEATLSGSRCVLGIASVWLDDVTLPDPLFDDAEFRRDPTRAYYLANLNLFTYLVAHHDGREGNFLMAKNPKRPQFFSVDNGVSLGGLFYNWFVPNWNSIRVPALRKASIDKLRAVEREDLAFLEVVAELELDENGIYKNVTPGKSLDPDRGALHRGTTVQFGLTEGEIDDVFERIRSLIDDVDAGVIQVF